MFFYLLLVIMLSRLYSLFKDEPLTVFRLFLMMVIQLLGLLIFEMSIGLFSLLIILLIIDYLEFRTEKKSSRLNMFRFISFLLLCIVISVFSSGMVNISLNNLILPGIENLFNELNPLSNLNITGMHIIIILSGLFFLWNESNLFIRFIFDVSGKIPMAGEPSEPDRKELNAGRIIGILERILIYFFVIIGQFAAVGFVIAAKGIVRYKELEDRNFAEYVLIGTLLSSLLSMLTGFIVAHLLV